jgi:hypothetical protein
MRQIWNDSANFGTGGYVLEDTPFAEDRIYDQRNVPSLGQALQGLISDTKQNAEGLFDRIVPSQYDSPEKIMEKMINLEGGQFGKSTFDQMIDPQLGLLYAGGGAKYPTHRRVGTTGQYVGAPNWVNSPQSLAKVRRDYVELVKDGIDGRDWYDQTNEFIRGAVPSDLTPRQMAEVLAVTSARTSVGANLGHAIKAINQHSAGAPLRAGGFPGNMMPNTQRMLDGEMGVLASQPKVGQYATNLLSEFDSKRPVNDIWQGRAFGYRKEDGSLWDSGFSDEQHAFMDRETRYLIDKLNNEKVGGFDDWDTKKLQAAGWTGVRKADPKIPMGNEAKSYGDFANPYKAYHTAEQVPMHNAGHLGLMAERSAADRAAYSSEANWIDPATGKDVLMDGLGLLTGTHTPYQGGFIGEGGLMQFNPGVASQSLIGFDAINKMDYGPLPRGVKAFDKKGKTPVGTGTKRVNKASSDLVEADLALRGLLDVQEGSAAHTSISPMKAGSQLGVDVTTKSGNPATQEEFEQLSRIASDNGFFAADRGTGTVSFINDPYSDLGKERIRQGGGLLGKQLKHNKPLGAALDKVRDKFSADRVAHESWYLDYSDALNNQGKGQATQLMMSKLSKVRPAAENALGSPRVKQEILNKISRDEKWAKKTGDVTRDDIQNLRKLMGEPGSGKETYSRIMKALKDGAIALPAVMLMIDGMPGAQDDGLI